MRTFLVAILTAVLTLALFIPAASAQAAPRDKQTAGAETTSGGGAAWASFTETDVVGQQDGGAVETAQGGTGVAVGDASASGSVQTRRPQVCSLQPLQTAEGVFQMVRSCRTFADIPQIGGSGTGGTGGAPASIVADPRVLAERAAAVLNLPAPAMRMSPAQDQVVQLPSWLWISAEQWEPRQKSAAAGPVTSTVTAMPVGVTWDMGNGDRVHCDGPGTPYQERYAQQPDATDCRYTYRHSSAGQPDEAYEVTATVDWELTWAATGAPGGGSLGSVPMSATQAVRVTEIQALVQ
jgi:hypothetical protein